MTESDWLTGNDSAGMLEQIRGRVSLRKLRLLICAYQRHHWNCLAEGTRQMVELVEGALEGQVSPRQQNAAEIMLSLLERAADPIRAVRIALERIADAVATEEAGEAASEVHPQGSLFVDTAVSWDSTYYNTIERVYHEEQRIQATLLRELLGNPFQPPTLDPAWLAWDDGAVVKVARSIYEERKFEEMTVLADALEEAGCTCPSILEHCRQPDGHRRGCWVVDFLLGRE
jgi:hypothetical protein